MVDSKVYNQSWIRVPLVNWTVSAMPATENTGFVFILTTNDT